MHRDYDRALSGRLGSFLATWQMFRDHPIVGVGPGAFAYEFFPYAIETQHRYGARLQLDIGGVNFHEAHNDHLQTLAETGLIGYALLLASFITVAIVSWSPRTEDKRAAFAHSLGFPLIASFFVLALGQFPLHITAVLMNDLFLAALICGWKETA